MIRPASRMPTLARALTLVAALLLGALYVTPLWSVRLVAPQYPEGIGMNIHVNTVTGAKEHDLRNINALNRYIGMKAIHPESIPELKYMPWILAVLIAAGVGAAALGRRRGLTSWLVILVFAGAAGLYDFWRWNYDFGHNLDFERAIIVIPDMSYQPPILGTKQIANFKATSYPALGGMLAGVAFLVGVGALFLSYRRGRMLSAAGAVFVATACAAGPPVLAVGEASCAECRMLISDGRFGAVLVMNTGKQLSFDSVECALEYLRQHQPAAAEVWVADASAHRTLVPAERAVFVVDAALRPPMGGIASYGSEASARAIEGDDVRTMDWTALRMRQPARAGHAG